MPDSAKKEMLRTGLASAVASAQKVIDGNIKLGEINSDCNGKLLDFITVYTNDHCKSPQATPLRLGAVVKEEEDGDTKPAAATTTAGGNNDSSSINSIGAETPAATTTDAPCFTVVEEEEEDGDKKKPAASASTVVDDEEDGEKKRSASTTTTAGGTTNSSSSTTLAATNATTTGARPTAITTDPPVVGVAAATATATGSIVLPSSTIINSINGDAATPFPGIAALAYGRGYDWKQHLASRGIAATAGSTVAALGGEPSLAGAAGTATATDSIALLSSTIINSNSAWGYSRGYDWKQPAASRGIAATAGSTVAALGREPSLAEAAGMAASGASSIVWRQPEAAVPAASPVAAIATATATAKTRQRKRRAKSPIHSPTDEPTTAKESRPRRRSRR
jgi:hypothetical protein